MRTHVCMMVTAFAVVSLAALVSCGKKSSRPAKPFVGELVVTYEYPNYSLPLAVALDRGFFAEEGLKVIPKKIGFGDDLGLSDFDVINGHDFYVLKEGRGSVFAAHFFSSKADFEKAMLVKKSAGISGWKDFKGKRIVVVDFDDVSLLDGLFKEHGLRCMGEEERDVTLSSGGGAVAGFSGNKNAHALYGASSTVLPPMREQPGKFVILWRDLGKENGSENPLVGCSYVKASLLPDKKEAVRAYVKAIDRAIDFIRKDPDGAVAVLPKYFDVDKKWARYMEVYEFHKSDEMVDFAALTKKLGVDLQGCVLDLSKE